jgi:hypothetical protein
MRGEEAVVSLLDMRWMSGLRGVMRQVKYNGVEGRKDDGIGTTYHISLEHSLLVLPATVAIGMPLGW